MAAFGRQDQFGGGGSSFFFVITLGKRAEGIGRREESLGACFLIDELLGRAFVLGCSAIRLLEQLLGCYRSYHRVRTPRGQNPLIAYHDGLAWNYERAQRQGLLANALRTP